MLTKRLTVSLTSGVTMSHPEPGAESAMLLRWLTGQREHVLGIQDGLSDADLRRSVLPSGWTCLGLVQHLALDVERFWFQHVVAGEPMDAEADADDAWQVGPDVAADDVLALYRRESARRCGDRRHQPGRGSGMVARILRQFPAGEPARDHAARHRRDRVPRGPPRRGA